MQKFAPSMDHSQGVVFLYFSKVMSTYTYGDVGNCAIFACNIHSRWKTIQKLWKSVKISQSYCHI